MKSMIFAGVSILALANVAVAKDTLPAKPMFKVQPGLHRNIQQPTALPTWDFTWTYSGTKYTAVFVGTKPTGGASTTVPVEIIPVIMKYQSTTENPSAGKANSPVSRTIASPIFDATTDYNQGGTDLGATQYEDAFQRGALWGAGVSANPGYHVLLGAPKVLKPLHITGSSVATEFGVKVILDDINSFDNAIQATVKAQPVDSIPIFITTNTYLTEGGCCIGGYHSYTGTQAYSMYTYIKKTGVFSQDVSALSHEIGEWMDDPLTDNNVHCGIYEVGDPLEGGEGQSHPYGTWAYPLGGFTYHLQDLVWPPYFGAPTSTSANGWFTFQGYKIGVCQNGG